MNTLGVWSFLAIFYQTCLCILISWLTLSCKLSPASSELAELTLVKLLYLYEPESCGRIHFYNYTTSVLSGAGMAIVWPVKNDVAVGFRSKIKVWLILHVMWTVLGIVNISQGNRPLGFYFTLLPFTLTGIALLVVDIAFCALFLADIAFTGSEAEILNYINSNSNNLHSINATLQRPVDAADTTWISVMMAYSSLRGIVQWIFNFWIVKDSYFNGVALYGMLIDHRLQKQTFKDKSCTKNVQMYRIRVS